MDSPVNQLEWNEWLRLPATRLLQHLARLRREDLRSAWETGSFVHETNFATCMQNARAQGECRALSLLEDLDFKAIISEVFDGEQERIAPKGAGGAGETVRAEEDE